MDPEELFRGLYHETGLRTDVAKSIVIEQTDLARRKCCICLKVNGLGEHRQMKEEAVPSSTSFSCQEHPRQSTAQIKSSQID